MPMARSISDHVSQVAQKVRANVIPIIVENLLAGGGAVTLDLATSKKEIITIAAHTMSEVLDEHEQKSFYLESNVLELISWDITKRSTRVEIRDFLVTVRIGF
jgi:tripartite-type tricarboxylate transporter receptor subunit TctC